MTSREWKAILKKMQLYWPDFKCDSVEWYKEMSHIPAVYIWMVVRERFGDRWAPTLGEVRMPAEKAYRQVHKLEVEE